MKKLFSFKFLTNINLPLLVFLIFFLNVKFVVKVIAILFIIIYSRNFKFGLSFKKSRLPLFYLLIIILEIFKYLLIVRNYSLNYALVFSMGILQWAMCLLSIHYIKLNVDDTDTNKMHSTIKAFFTLNFIVSLCFLLILFIHPVWLTYWGHEADLTFNNTSIGDIVMGITFDTSTVNATLNSIGLIYFLYKRDYLFCLLCLITIVLCTSNVTVILTLGILILMIITVRQKKLRLSTMIFSIALVVLYLFSSPKNREYMRNYFINLYVVNKNPEQKQIIDTQVYHLKVNDSVVTIKNAVEVLPDTAYTFTGNRLEKAVGNLISSKDLHKDDSTGFVNIPDNVYNTRPGKLISFLQTYFYLKESFKHLLFGSGIGNFSSKLAFRASGVRALGTYPQKFRYVSPDFKYNHLHTYLYYKNEDASKHSVLNYPFTVYNQLLGEYGLLGSILFIIYYLGYFLSRHHRLSYGRYMIISLLGFFLMEYWFELFSLVVIFELFIFLNIKEGRSRPDFETSS